jgi:hypothetical protein
MLREDEGSGAMNWEQPVVDVSWMRSTDDLNAEQARERAMRRDPHHPQRRSKGENRRRKVKA